MKRLPPKRTLEEVIKLVGQHFGAMPDTDALLGMLEEDVNMNPGKSLSFYRRVEELWANPATRSKAINMVAIEYDDGDYLTQHTGKAIMWTMLAASKRHSGAINNLALFVADEDEDLAFQLLMQAVEIDNNENARENLRLAGFDV